MKKTHILVALAAALALAVVGCGSQQQFDYANGFLDYQFKRLARLEVEITQLRSIEPRTPAQNERLGLIEAEVDVTHDLLARRIDGFFRDGLRLVTPDLVVECTLAPGAEYKYQINITRPQTANAMSWRFNTELPHAGSYQPTETRELTAPLGLTETKRESPLGPSATIEETKRTTRPEGGE